VACAFLAFEEVVLPVIPFRRRCDAVIAHREGVSERVDHRLDLELRVDGEGEMVVRDADFAQNREGQDDVAGFNLESRVVVLRRGSAAGLGEFCKCADRKVFREASTAVCTVF